MFFMDFSFFFLINCFIFSSLPLRSIANLFKDGFSLGEINWEKWVPSFLGFFRLFKKKFKIFYEVLSRWIFWGRRRTSNFWFFLGLFLIIHWMGTHRWVFIIFRASTPRLILAQLTGRFSFIVSSSLYCILVHFPFWKFMEIDKTFFFGIIGLNIHEIFTNLKMFINQELFYTEAFKGSV